MESIGTECFEKSVLRSLKLYSFNSAESAAGTVSVAAFPFPVCGAEHADMNAAEKNARNKYGTVKCCNTKEDSKNS